MGVFYWRTGVEKNIFGFFFNLQNQMVPDVTLNFSLLIFLIQRVASFSVVMSTLKVEVRGEKLRLTCDRRRLKLLRHTKPVFAVLL